MTLAPAAPSPTRWPASVRLYLTSFLIVGMSLSMLGPALTELREKSGSGIGAIGVLFMGQSLGYVVGPVIGGRLYDRLDGHRVFAGGLLVLAAGLLAVPHLDTRPTLFVAFVTMGFGASVVDLGGNTLLMWELKADGHRAMNLLHMFFGIGAVVAPLLVYAGLLVVSSIGAAFCVVMAAVTVRIPAPPHPVSGREEHTRATVPILAMLGGFFTIYVGTELGYAGWIKTYGEEIAMSELTATWLTTAFWLSFTAGRAVASVIAHRVTPAALLWATCGATVLAAMLLIAGDGSVPVVWLGTIVIGMAMGPQFASMMNLIERRIHVSGSATMWFVGGAGLGGLVFPWAIGQWLDRSGATALPWAMLLFGTATLAAFASSARVLRRRIL